MKQTLLIFFLCSIFCYNLSAQSFSVSTPIANLQSSLQYELSPNISITNLTNKPITLQWEIDKQSLPAEWAAQICDKNCKTLDSKNNTFTLNAHETLHNFRALFTTNNYEGKGQLDVRVFEPTKRSASEKLLSFSVNAMAQNSNSLRVYPNPVVDDFMVQDDEALTKSIEIFNILGKKTSEFQVQSNHQSFNIGHLPRGIYMVRFIDNKGNILRTQRISKINP